MAKVRFGPEGMSWSGKVGHAVYRTMNGQTYIQQKPEWNDRRKPSQKELDNQKRLARASRYGSRASRIPELRPIYEGIARREQKPFMAMANRDALNPPVVDEIDVSSYAGAPGDVIAVAASDDTGVVSVEVALADDNGDTFEHGPAELDADGWWLYTARTRVPEGTEVRVAASAKDRPRGQGCASTVTVVRGGAPGPVRRRNLRGASRPTPPNAPHHDGIAEPASQRAMSNERSAGATSDPISAATSNVLDPARLLRDARARAGLSQRELARRAGKSQAVVSRIEKGRTSPTVETLLRLLHAAGFEAIAELAARPAESTPVP